MIHAWKALKKYADICFKIVINLHKHIETYHSNINEKKELKCDHCVFKTKREDSLLRYERCVHDMYDKSFDDIDNTFDNLSEMEWQCKNFRRFLIQQEL